MSVEEYPLHFCRNDRSARTVTSGAAGAAAVAVSSAPAWEQAHRHHCLSVRPGCGEHHAQQRFAGFHAESRSSYVETVA
jgi:hypothetical protein